MHATFVSTSKSSEVIESGIIIPWLMLGMPSKKSVRVVSSPHRIDIRIADDLFILCDEYGS